MTALAGAVPVAAGSRPPRATTGRAMRILMTLDAVGGVWRYAMELARALRAGGTEVVFVGMGPAPGAGQRAEARALGTLEWLDASLDWMAEGPEATAELAPKLRDLVVRHSVDVAHLNLPSQAAALHGAVPVVTVSHSCLPTWWNAVRGGALPPAWEWHWRANRDGFGRAEVVVAPSRSHADQLLACYGPLPRLEVVHNAMGGHLPVGAKQSFILAVGRWWDEGKNARILDEVAPGLDWPLVLAGAGTGPDGSGVSFENVEQPRALPHPKVLELVSRAAILVSPSLYEPFGLAALEGARARAALVLADIPTYRELWKDAALFFDPRDPRALAAALRRLTGDATLRRDMGARALAASQPFTPERQAARMIAIYRRAAGLSAAAEAAGG